MNGLNPASTLVNHNKKLDKVTRVLESELNRSEYLSLDKNERLIPFSDSFIQNVRDKITSRLFSSYPNLKNSYRVLSDHAGVDLGEIFISAGSEYTIKSVIESFLEPGFNIVLHKPSYAMYELYSKIAGAKIKSIDFSSNFTLAIDRMIDAIDNKTRILVIENPNGFIGSEISLNQLERIAIKCKEKRVCLVVDEAYYGFCNVTAASLINRYDNIIIIRSFSKVYGLAGLRIGYCISNKKIISLIKKTRPMHEITSFSALVLEGVGEQEDDIQSYIESVEQSKSYTIRQLERIGINSLKTKTNFILSKLPLNLNQEYYRNNKILVRRPFAESFLCNYTRITIGSQEQMNRFVDVTSQGLSNKLES